MGYNTRTKVQPASEYYAGQPSAKVEMTRSSVTLELGASVPPIDAKCYTEFYRIFLLL